MSLLHLSASFRETMRRIRYESVVAELVLYGEHGEVTAERIDYLAARGGMISFLPAGKVHQVNGDGTWRREGRQTGRPAKVIRQVFTESGLSRLTDKDFELFANKIKADGLMEDGTFDLVKGGDIRYWYHENQYADDSQTGTLGHSCMRDDTCQDFFGIYTDNPEVCQMLIMTNDDDELIGRALVWQTNEGTFMDRIYGTDATQEAFKEYAQERGWMYRRWQSYDNLRNIMRNGEEEYLNLRVDLRNAEHDYYPWLDTMMYLHLGEGFVANTSSWGYDETLQHTDGGPFNTSMQECYECGDRINDDETYSTDDGTPYCYSCYHIRFTHCFYCGRTVESDDSMAGPDGHDYCESCYTDRFTACVECQRDIRRSQATEDEDGDPWCESCYNNTFFRCDDCDDETRHEDGSLREGRTICPECTAEYDKKIPDFYQYMTGNLSPTLQRIRHHEEMARWEASAREREESYRRARLDFEYAIMSGTAERTDMQWHLTTGID